MRAGIVWVFSAALLLGACGHTMEERAATGAVAGLIVAGPAGAAVGALGGAVINEVVEDDNERLEGR